MTNVDYQTLTNKLQTVLPGNWEKVVLFAQLGADSYELFFHVLKDGRYESCFKLGRDEAVSDVFDDLYQVMLPDWRGKKWSVCTFSLDRDGQFDLEYDYSAYPDNLKDVLEYKRKWKEKHLV